MTSLNFWFSVSTGFVKNVLCPKDIIKHCVPCEKGKEFMNHPNDLDKCWRCKSCDSKFGMSIEITTVAMTHLSHTVFH